MGRTLKRIWKEVIAHPFFPLLFIGKAVEVTGFALVGSATLVEVGIMWVLAVVAVVLWTLSDSLNVEFDKESFVG